MRRHYKPSEDLLKDKIILVTGAGRGIGRAVSKAYASLGAHVILLGKTIKHLNETYDDIIKNNDPQPAIYPLDLSVAGPDHYKQLGLTLTKNYDRLDGVLHNAASLADLAPFELLSIKQWYSVMQTNVNAPFLMMQQCLPLLKKSKNASVIFTLSDQVDTPKAYWGANSVSKHAAKGLMELLNAECADSSIRVNAINPGPVRTALRAKAYPAENPENIPPPEIVLPAYLYLMGDDSLKESGKSFSLQKPKGGKC